MKTCLNNIVSISAVYLYYMVFTRYKMYLSSCFNYVECIYVFKNLKCLLIPEYETIKLNRVNDTVSGQESKDTNYRFYFNCINILFTPFTLLPHSLLLSSPFPLAKPIRHLDSIAVFFLWEIIGQKQNMVENTYTGNT